MNIPPGHSQCWGVLNGFSNSTRLWVQDQETFFPQCPGCSSPVSALELSCISMCSAWGQVNWSWASWNEHQVSCVLVNNSKINDNRKLLMGDFGQTSPGSPDQMRGLWLSQREISVRDRKPQPVNKHWRWSGDFFYIENYYFINRK